MKRLLLSTVLLFVLNAPGFAEIVKLPENTEVDLQTTELVDLKSHNDGDVIPLIVINDVIGLDGKTVFIKAGTKATAFITSSSKVVGFNSTNTGNYSTGQFYQRQVLVIAPHHVRMVNGESVSLAGYVSSTDKGAGTGWRAAIAVPIIGLFAIPGAISAKQANRAHITPDTIIRAFTTKDVYIE